MRLMDSRRLVVWISTGILGFQGATLAFDLLNCTALSWLYVRMNGLPAMERGGSSRLVALRIWVLCSSFPAPPLRGTLWRCSARGLKGGLMTR
jgi:hypothetical protein